MNFNVLSNIGLKSINKVSLKNVSNQLAFKGLDQDTFEKSTDEKLSVKEQVKLIKKVEQEVEIESKILSSQIRVLANNIIDSMRNGVPVDHKELCFEREQKEKQLEEVKQKREKIIAKLNPNIAFLSDSTISWPHRRKILGKHDEIIRFSKSLSDGAWSNALGSGKYFILNKTNIGLYIDTSWDVNSSNYEELMKGEPLSMPELCNKYGFSQKEINRYINEGMLKPKYLTNLETGEKEPIHIIDLSDEENLQSVERHNALQTILQNANLENPYEDKDVISAKKLSELGFGTQKEIMEAVKFHKLPGKIISKETPEGAKTCVLVAYKQPKAVGELKFLRNENKTIVNFEQLGKIAHVDMTTLEDALLSGEIEYIPYSLYDDDKNKILFSIKNPKNLKFINQKIFEYEIAQEQIKSEIKEKASLRTTIVWALCPNTRQVAKIITSQQPQYKEIFEKLDKIKDYDRRASKNELEEDEIRPFLTKDERIKLKIFYKTLWNQAGLDEYRSAMSKAKEAILQYKENGIDGVEDEEIKAAIKEFYESK